MPREPQTQPMSVGSAFDAYVKSHLHESVYGKGKDPKYEFTALFEAQVEPHNRDWALDAGKYAFERYVEGGALSDLMQELATAISEPRFELSLTGVVEGYREGITAKKMGVPLNGKPDLYFINANGVHVIHDWKVNGFCSKYPISPTAGYIKIRDCWNTMVEPASRGGYMHKDAVPLDVCGMWINGASGMEFYEEKWATQLATYAWLLGEPVGSDFIASIDQLVCKPNGLYPKIRCASHRARITANFQFIVMNDYQQLWDIINTEPLYLFQNLPYEQSKAKQEMLEEQAIQLYGKDAELTSDEVWLVQSSKAC